MKKLQLGAFDQGLEGWVNTDITPHLFIAKIPGLTFMLRGVGLLPEDRYRQHRAGTFARLRYLNVARNFPFADASFDCVYSSHMLEHLHPGDANHCLSEIHRILKPGGVVRVAVPDLAQVMKKYVPETPEEFLEELYESKQKSMKNRHHWHYNEFSLRRSLEAVGFRNIFKESFRQGRCQDLNLIEHREESLFMEAVR